MDNFYQSPGNDKNPEQGRRRRVRWYAGGAATLLAVGVIGGVALAGNSTTPASRAVPAAATGQAAQLNALLSSAASPATSAPASSLAGASPGAPAAAAAPPGSAAFPAAGRCVRIIRRLRTVRRPRAERVVRRHCRRAIRRRIGLRLLGGMHGQFTFRTGHGIRTLAYERGVIESAASTGVTVRAADGTTWTWDLVAGTVIRENGARAGPRALSGGEQVFVGGPVGASVKDARLIVIRPGE